MRGFSRWSALAALLAFTCTPVLAQQCAPIQLRVTAAPSHDSAFPNLYKYTFRGSWNLGPGAHATGDLFVQLPTGSSCPCVCSKEFMHIPPAAGTATGSRRILGRRCAVTYTGGFGCNGDVAIGSTQPTLHFEAVDRTCENSTTRGVWVVYSPVPPAPYANYTDAVVLLAGASVCTGNLVGQLPDCRLCVVIGLEPATWSAVKSLYK